MDTFHSVSGFEAYTVPYIIHNYWTFFVEYPEHFSLLHIFVSVLKIFLLLYRHLLYAKGELYEIIKQHFI